MLLLGAPGTGKSIGYIRPNINQAIKRKEPILMFNIKRNYLNIKDVFNDYNKREYELNCINNIYNPFYEMKIVYKNHNSFLEEYINLFIDIHFDSFFNLFIKDENKKYMFKILFNKNIEYLLNNNIDVNAKNIKDNLKNIIKYCQENEKNSIFRDNDKNIIILNLIKEIMDYNNLSYDSFIKSEIDFNNFKNKTITNIITELPMFSDGQNITKNLTSLLIKSLIIRNITGLNIFIDEAAETLDKTTLLQLEDMNNNNLIVCYQNEKQIQYEFKNNNEYEKFLSSMDYIVSLLTNDIYTEKSIFTCEDKYFLHKNPYGAAIKSMESNHINNYNPNTTIQTITPRDIINI